MDSRIRRQSSIGDSAVDGHHGVGPLLDLLALPEQENLDEAGPVAFHFYEPCSSYAPVLAAPQIGFPDLMTCASPMTDGPAQLRRTDNRDQSPYRGKTSYVGHPGYLSSRFADVPVLLPSL